MDLVWLGHSSFRLHSQGMVVVTDPFPESLGLRLDGRAADIITVSNTHPNHSAAETVSGEPRVFRAPGEYEFSHVVVRGVMTLLPEGAPHEQRNVAFSIEMDGISVCHLGDLTRPLRRYRRSRTWTRRSWCRCTSGTARTASPSTAWGRSCAGWGWRTRHSRSPGWW